MSPFTPKAYQGGLQLSTAFSFLRKVLTKELINFVRAGGGVGTRVLFVTEVLVVVLRLDPWLAPACRHSYAYVENIITWGIFTFFSNPTG